MFNFHIRINTANLPFFFLQLIYKNGMPTHTPQTIPYCCDLLHKPVLCHSATFVTEQE